MPVMQRVRSSCLCLIAFDYQARCKSLLDSSRSCLCRVATNLGFAARMSLRFPSHPLAPTVSSKLLRISGCLGSFRLFPWGNPLKHLPSVFSYSPACCGGAPNRGRITRGTQSGFSSESSWSMSRTHHLLITTPLDSSNFGSSGLSYMTCNFLRSGSILQSEARSHPPYRILLPYSPVTLFLHANSRRKLLIES